MNIETPHPIEIQDSLRRFREDFPDPATVAFVMMRFAADGPYALIISGIRDCLKPLGISAVRADDKQYHKDFLSNILTYVYGAGIGLAVFDRTIPDSFNPNIALELGYMMALRKPVCLLKDRTLQSLHSDLVGRLYRPFDPPNATTTISQSIKGWLKDRNMLPEETSSLRKEVKHPLRFGGGDTSDWTPEEISYLFS
jgi:hypothetical protein